MFSVCLVLLAWVVLAGLVSAQKYLALRCCQQSAAPGFVVLVTSGLFVQQTSPGRRENPFIACRCVYWWGELWCVTVRVKHLLWGSGVHLLMPLLHRKTPNCTWTCWRWSTVVTSSRTRRTSWAALTRLSMGPCPSKWGSRSHREKWNSWKILGLMWTSKMSCGQWPNWGHWESAGSSWEGVGSVASLKWFPLCRQLSVRNSCFSKPTSWC